MTAQVQIKQGYSPLYRSGTVCPGCGGAKWDVGRFSAECTHCHTALPLAPADRSTGAPMRVPAWADRP